MTSTETKPEQSPREAASAAPFELGLVMAGAVSAGAYTAGVMDFLIEALDAWEEEKARARKNPDDPKSREAPNHDVRLKVLAGASAGGITAAIAAGQLGMRFDPVRVLPADGKPAAASNNNLYQSWVNRIDIEPLLGLDDLEGRNPPPVRSLLDSTILEKIADEAFQFDDPQARINRPYVADPLQVVLTVTNLRGVPYAPQFLNWPKVLQYEMMMHADNVRFELGNTSPCSEADAFWLKPYDFQNPATWGFLQQAALASGAFPLGLAPRLLSRSPVQYQNRPWRFPGPLDKDGVHYCQYWKRIPPHWPSVEKAEKAGQETGSPYLYKFLCVDGGVMDNEPLDLARQALVGPQAVERFEGDKVTHSVIMIMPFPNAAPFPAEYQEPSHLLSVLATMFNSLIQQARFRPEELVSANNPDVYSRFLIVPRRGLAADGSPEPYTIACGSLGGFGGFLARKFREHDYQLGRRNCQWFLKQYFALPCEGERRNPLFDRWTSEARDKFRIRKAAGSGAKSHAVGTGSDDLHLLPIIPLVGTAAETVPEPAWPQLSRAEFEALRPRIERRLDCVASCIIRERFPSSTRDFFSRIFFHGAWWLNKHRLIQGMMERIDSDLTEKSLLEPRKS